MVTLSAALSTVLCREDHVQQVHWRRPLPVARCPSIFPGTPPSSSETGCFIASTASNCLEQLTHQGDHEREFHPLGLENHPKEWTHRAFISHEADDPWEQDIARAFCTRLNLLESLAVYLF